jgi:hypothetical protein
VFENRILRRIFGSERDEVIKEWRKLHDELLHIYTPPQILLGRSNQGVWGGRYMWRAKERNMWKVVMGKPEGKRPLRRTRRRWEDEIGMDLMEIGWGSVDWMQLAQDRDRWRDLVNTAMNIRVLAPRS